MSKEVSDNASSLFETDSLGSARATLPALRLLALGARSIGICVQPVCASQAPRRSGMLTRLRCAQGSLVASKDSIAFREILIFTTNREICFRSNRNPGWLQQIEFGRSFGTAEKQGRAIQSSRVENGRHDDHRPTHRHFGSKGSPTNHNKFSSERETAIGSRPIRTRS
jgi:hypothetical protein